MVGSTDGVVLCKSTVEGPAEGCALSTPLLVGASDKALVGIWLFVGLVEGCTLSSKVVLGPVEGATLGRDVRVGLIDGSKLDNSTADGCVLGTADSLCVDAATDSGKDGGSFSVLVVFTELGLTVSG